MPIECGLNETLQGPTDRFSFLVFVDIHDKPNYKAVKEILIGSCHKPKRHLTHLDKQHIVMLFKTLDHLYQDRSIHMMHFEVSAENRIDEIITQIKLVGLQVHKIIRYSHTDKEYTEKLYHSLARLTAIGSQLFNVYSDVSDYLKVADNAGNWRALINHLSDYKVVQSIIKQEHNAHMNIAYRFMKTIVKYPTA